MAKVNMVAVNEVEYLDGRQKKYAQPGTIFPLDDTLVEKLEKRRAVRQPTPEELALYEKQNGLLSRRSTPKSGDDQKSSEEPASTKQDGRAKGKSVKREEAPV
jgi:hypothetical protein